ncbi:hypothetical protein MMC22_003732 [Lobaria immixta]|nr:hypothetical protein [Lobaria immixta]
MAASDCFCRFLLEYKRADNRKINTTPMTTPTLIPPLAPPLNPEEPELVADNGVGVRLPPLSVVLELEVEEGAEATEAFEDAEEIDDGLREYADKSPGAGA